MLIIRGVDVFPSNIEAVLAKEGRLAPTICWNCAGPEVWTSWMSWWKPAWFSPAKSAARNDALERHAEHLIKWFVGITTKLRVVEPGRSNAPRARRNESSIRPKD